MAFMKKSSKKKSSAPRRKAYTRRPRPTKTYRVFEEVCQVSPITVNQTSSASATGQLWTIAMSSVPQAASYQALYDEYKILSIKYHFIPSFNVADQGQQQENAYYGTPYTGMPTIAYHVSKDGGATAPLNELQVLTRNGCKVAMFNKPLTVTVNKPQPFVTVVDGNTTNKVDWEQTGWLPLDANGSIIEHFGIQTYTVDKQASMSPGYSIGRVYATIKFALRSPL